MRTTESGTKFKPLIVMSPVAPTASDDGEIELITGVPGATTVRKNGAESELAELRTFTANEPASIRSAPLMIAVSEPSVLNVVGTSLPRKITFDVGRNASPEMRIVALSDPRRMDGGSTESIVGRRTSIDAGVDVTPLSVTVIESDPGAAISASEMFAVSAPVDDCTDVAFADPFTLITDVDEKFEPVTFTWNPGSPEITLVGVTESIVGTGTAIEKSTVGEI